MLSILVGDAREKLSELPPESVQCCVTSPPYWGLRDYGVEGQIGLEDTLEQFIEQMVLVFSSVKRALKQDGTVWLNLGDCYATGGRGGGSEGSKQTTNTGSWLGPKRAPAGFKHKDILGLPWRVAFALQQDGWYLRSDIIWHKPNSMPESVTDRPTRAHEYIFLLTKSPSYYYDAEAIRTPAQFGGILKSAYSPPGQPPHSTSRQSDKQRGHSRRHAGFNDRWDKLSVAEQRAQGANKRTVWTVATAGFKGAHFATFPPDLIRPCILAGTRPGDTVLDPFGGSGTTGMVSLELGRSAILIELNPEYAAIAEQRCNVTAGLPL